MSTHEQDVIIPPIEFVAGGDSEEVRTANLESVLPSPGFPDAAVLMADAIVKRADIAVLDFTPRLVEVRYQIDGIWHTLQPRDRQAADYMLATLKRLSNTNYQERRLRQEGSFVAKFRGHKSKCRFISQGVKTGERVAIYIDRAKPPLETLSDLGMRPKNQEKLMRHLSGKSGLVLFSTMPGDGLSSLWYAARSACDRLVRDYYAFEEIKKPEKEIINITQMFYDSSKGETPLDFLYDLMLKEPDVLCFTELINADVINRMCDLVLNENKLVFAAVHSKSATEALLRVLVHRCDLKKFSQAIQCVVNGRLVRRLCEGCKQPFTPAPQLLQKLGIPQGRVDRLFSKYQPPPPESLVDEQGNPIPPPVCQFCENLGFVERIGLYEVLDIDDHLRETLVATPDLKSLNQAAKESGQVTIRDEGIVVVAKGLTSIDELQRCLTK
jgi:type II secretory ATPase GspE/PulE/Tfp pilus assembly ATPase PilB-like protein